MALIMASVKATLLIDHLHERAPQNNLLYPRGRALPLSFCQQVSRRQIPQQTFASVQVHGLDENIKASRLSETSQNISSYGTRQIAPKSFHQGVFSS